MTSHNSYFFQATQSVSDDLGEMFSFTWASYLGLREMWWQVRGFKASYPELSHKQIENKFVGAVPLPGGIDFSKLMLKTSWEEHEQRFAKQILFEACTMYEGWLEAVCTRIFTAPKNAKNVADQLQFPKGHISQSKVWDFSTGIAEINKNVSPLTRDHFFVSLKLNPLNCWDRFDDFITCYRYFKECRNSFIHSSGVANSRVIDAHSLLGQIENPFIPFAHAFTHEFNLFKPEEGTRMRLDIHDCKLFATTVHRMIVTLDAAFSVNKACEEIIRDAVVRVVDSKKHKWNNLSASSNKRLAKVYGLLNAARLPKPVDIVSVDRWLTTQSLI